MLDGSSKNSFCGQVFLLNDALQQIYVYMKTT